MTGILESHCLWGHVTGARPCSPTPVPPPAASSTPSSAAAAADEAATEAAVDAIALSNGEPENAYQCAPDALEHWRADEHQVLAFLIRSVSCDIAVEISKLPSSQAIWTYLEQRNHQRRDALRFSLLKQLQSLQQGDSTVASFYRQFTCLWSQLDSLDPSVCLSCQGCSTCQGTQQAQRDKLRLYDFVTRLRPEIETFCAQLVSRSMTTVNFFSALQAEETRLRSLSEQPLVPVLVASTSAPTSAPTTLTPDDSA